MLDHRIAGSLRKCEDARSTPHILATEVTTIERHDVRRTIALLLCGGMLVAMPLVTGHAAHLEVIGGVAQTFTVEVDNPAPAGLSRPAGRSATAPTKPAVTSEPGPTVTDVPTSTPVTETKRGGRAPSIPTPSTGAGYEPAPTQTTPDTSPLPTPDPTPSGESPEPSPAASDSPSDATTTEDVPDASTPDAWATE